MAVEFFSRRMVNITLSQFAKLDRTAWCINRGASKRAVSGLEPQLHSGSGK